MLEGPSGGKEKTKQTKHDFDNRLHQNYELDVHRSYHLKTAFFREQPVSGQVKNQSV